MILTVPIRVVSEANAHTHWRERQRRAKAQRQAVALHMLGKERPRLPVLVTMTRLAPRMLDDDNLVGAFKHVRDEIANAYGIDDRDRKAYHWQCEQEKSKEYGVRIEIAALLSRTNL